MSQEVTVALPDEAATMALGEQLSKAIGGAGGSVWLQGDLGAGKTTLARSFIQAQGHGGRVVSPTYTLMEPYDVGGRRLLHLDLYRIADAEELEFLGIRDMETDEDLLLVEWPERGKGLLPRPDLRLCFSDADGGGRHLKLTAYSERGQSWCESLGEDSPALS